MGQVYGTLSAAMASLLDAGFEIPEIGRWIDPSGVEWTLDFSQPMAIPAIRQVLTHFLQLGMWHRASNHTFASSLGLFPDLKPLKVRTQQAKRKLRWEEYYFLHAIGQGSMDLFAESSLVRAENGLVTCLWCSCPVHGSPWKHLAWFCSHFAGIDDPAIQKTTELAVEAQAEVDDFPTLWLRGIPNLEPPPCPLALNYDAMQASIDGLFVPDEPGTLFNVEGMLLGGDGSGGEHTKDSRLRRGGFGLVALDSLTLVVARMWYGSVPGA